MTAEETKIEFESKSELLCRKIKREFDAYIDIVRNTSIDEVIASAHEIAAKDDIYVWLCTRRLSEYLTLRQIDALLTADNILDEIYETVMSGCEGNIEYAVTETADELE